MNVTWSLPVPPVVNKSNKAKPLQICRLESLVRRYLRQGLSGSTCPGTGNFRSGLGAGGRSGVGVGPGDGRGAGCGRGGSVGLVDID